MSDKLCKPLRRKVYSKVRVRMESWEDGLDGKIHSGFFLRLTTWAPSMGPQPWDHYTPIMSPMCTLLDP